MIKMMKSTIILRIKKNNIQQFYLRIKHLLQIIILSGNKVFIKRSKILPILIHNKNKH